ncbi:O-antigen ligase family protein [uncultured Psychroserpens sp.]|uniref:O-antigen ligase family protein n=1 Tax=uncultured Psychroserpens sp. TaxID=255436 RepID=UPI0026296492|nr:O-antigen ligase family protein [uncultured Psychroserpens sp.]
MKLLRYIILMLLLWEISSFSLEVFGETAGSYTSHLANILLIGYYFLSKKRKLLFPFLILGLLYFMISGLVEVPDAKAFINEFIKYLILIVGGAEIARDTGLKDLCFILLIGSLSILVHSLFFVDGYGRYSGFYLDPNAAAFVSLIGYCLTYKLQNRQLRLILLFAFTFTGVITFSRFFLIMWLFISILSVFSNRKNAQGLLIGFGALLLLVSVAAILQVNTARFSIIESLFESEIQTTAFTEDSRTKQWTSYLDDIYDNPIFGNGYKSFMGSSGRQGVHNTYLMVIGESGIVPFLLLIAIYVSMFFKSLPFFKSEIHLTLMAISLVGMLMVIHNYFSNDFLIFISMWLLVKLGTSTQTIMNEEVDTDTTLIRPL